MRYVRTICAAMGVGIVIGLTAVSAAWAADGWQKNDKDQWVYYEGETLVKNRWIRDTDGSWMYVDSGGARVAEKSVSIQGSQYVFDERGHLLTGGWVALSADRKDPDEQVKNNSGRTL